ncbi:MAG: NADP-dependent oxidoreductase [Chloroflexi bacterium]|nr:NADP-dependent oxidoreductase [Chloroflexota bacterium]MCY3936893.1 NADP-dependent oxidoreductase [Chloroflexota bacterium]
MADRVNRRWLLASYPTGEPSLDNFEFATAPIPEPSPGQVLVRSIYMSLDPYMRGRMRPGPSYTTPNQIGDVIEAGAVGVVESSRHPDVAEGSIVQGRIGWQEYAVLSGEEVRVVDPSLAPISTALGVLGMPGMTAYFGFLEVGRPKSAETVLVSAASGAVGGLVGQIAKIKGCRVVGIAGTEAKCSYVADELGYDASINHRTADVKREIQRLCPDGVDVYFDNVGGKILDATLQNINVGARIVICGMISEYNLPTPEIAPRPTRKLLVRRARMEGFLVFDFEEQYPDGRRQMAEWIDEGRIKYKEDVVEGLENAPEAFFGLLKGENFGKLLIKVSDEPDGL